jgi:hypothetical protein
MSPKTILKNRHAPSSSKPTSTTVAAIVDPDPALRATSGIARTDPFLPGGASTLTEEQSQLVESLLNEDVRRHLATAEFLKRSRADLLMSLYHRLLTSWTVAMKSDEKDNNEKSSTSASSRMEAFLRDPLQRTTEVRETVFQHKMGTIVQDTENIILRRVAVRRKMEEQLRVEAYDRKFANKLAIILTMGVALITVVIALILTNPDRFHAVQDWWYQLFYGSYFADYGAKDTWISESGEKVPHYS